MGKRALFLIHIDINVNGNIQYIQNWSREVFSITKHFSISDLADMFDVTPRTIRYYEELGMLTPERRGTQRIYQDKDRVVLQLILRGRRLGFTLQEISEILALYDTDPTEITQLREVVSRGNEKLAVIENQIRDLETVRDELLDWRERMERLLAEKLQGEAEK